jgi:serine/threonine protein phosphatase PrpC
MMIDSSFGFVENGNNSLGFDSISINKNIFCLADGANSSRFSGEAAKLITSQLTKEHKNPVLEDFDHINKKFAATHKITRKKFPSAAATAISIYVSDNGLQIASCGDSLCEVYKYVPLLGWKKKWNNNLDLLSDNVSPSQLIGSEAYWGPSYKKFSPKGLWLITAMSDGIYKFTTNNERHDTLKAIKKNSPSNEDLSFLSQKITQKALENRSSDDASILIIWVRFK